MTDTGSGPGRTAAAATVVAAVALVALTVAGGATVWAWSQDEPVAGPLPWVCAAASVAGLAASVPLRREGSGGGFAGTGVRVAGFLLLTLGAVFLAAQIAQTVRDRLHEPRSVPATVTHCRVTGQVPVEGGGLGDRTYACTFRWSVDGREFSAERPEGPYPEGKAVRVWLADDGRMSTGRPSLVSVPVFGIPAVFLLAGAVFLGGWLLTDARTALGWHRRARRRQEPGGTARGQEGRR
ncbi:hypothetical protein [Streptomyces sp. NRRL S-350]|uniref:hypothetical protein n=1 Tax=Streptomyces sp. NRRL S-350 TaxID=1463902 RepID=UPI0004C19D59|nr:hypothetical protein [Streptomyces sp. NRRL S-350]